MEKLKPFACGGIASIVAELGNNLATWATTEFFHSLQFHIQTFLSSGTFPIDTTKTRLQIQEGFHGMKYNGMLDCGRKILREEGFRSLYNGISPGMLDFFSFVS